MQMVGRKRGYRLGKQAGSREERGRKGNSEGISTASTPIFQSARNWYAVSGRREYERSKMRNFLARRGCVCMCVCGGNKISLGPGRRSIRSISISNIPLRDYSRFLEESVRDSLPPFTRLFKTVSSIKTRKPKGVHAIDARTPTLAQVPAVAE